MKNMCQKLRHPHIHLDVKPLCPSDNMCQPQNAIEDDEYPISSYDLLNQLLDPSPFSRITAQEALQHPFLCD